MQKAIAGGGRACQAAALAIVLLLPFPLAHGQNTSGPAETYFEARTPDGVVVREKCIGPPTGRGESVCGTLAKRAADVITRLSPLAGPFPRKTLTLEPVHFGNSLRVARNRPGEIEASDTVFRFADSDGFALDALPLAIARQWFLFEVLVKAKDAWLVRALPEYLGWRYLLETNSQAAAAVVAQAVRDAAADGVVWPLSEGDPRGKNRSVLTTTVPGRGMLVLRTLETVIDRERVDRVLPEVMHRAAGQPPTAALLEKVCEEIAGRKLDWFFDYYVQGRQIPTIEVRQLPSESPGVTAGEIVLKDFPPEGSVRVEMTVRTAQGVVEHSVATHGAVTPFTVNVPAAALGITLDPDLRILRWTEAARRAQAQAAILSGLPRSLTRRELPRAIALVRRALAADPEDASAGAQILHEWVGELEWAHDEWNAALADLDAAINGHSIDPFETYLCRGKAYLYHGIVQLHERRPKEAKEDARAGLALPRVVLLQEVPREPIESHGNWTLEQMLNTLSEAASRY